MGRVEETLFGGETCLSQHNLFVPECASAALQGSNFCRSCNLVT